MGQKEVVAGVVLLSYGLSAAVEAHSHGPYPFMYRSRLDRVWSNTFINFFVKRYLLALPDKCMDPCTLSGAVSQMMSTSTTASYQDRHENKSG